MNSKANNSMVYTGIVTLSRCIKGQKIKCARLKNAGSLALFDFLSDCLIGDFDAAAAKKPNKIRLLKKDTTLDTETYQDKSGFIFVSNVPEKSNIKATIGTVRYSFIITREQLVSDFDYIGLYPANAVNDETSIDNYAAIVSVPDSISTSFATGTDTTALIIDWELNISNKETA